MIIRGIISFLIFISLALDTLAHESVIVKVEDAGFDRITDSQMDNIQKVYDKTNEKVGFIYQKHFLLDLLEIPKRMTRRRKNHPRRIIEKKLDASGFANLYFNLSSLKFDEKNGLFVEQSGTKSKKLDVIFFFETYPIKEQDSEENDCDLLFDLVISLDDLLKDPEEISLQVKEVQRIQKEKMALEEKRQTYSDHNMPSNPGFSRLVSNELKKDYEDFVLGQEDGFRECVHFCSENIAEMDFCSNH